MGYGQLGPLKIQNFFIYDNFLKISVFLRGVSVFCHKYI